MTLLTSAQAVYSTGKRASSTCSPVRFFVREIAGKKGFQAIYRVRGTTVSVALRHRTPDVLSFDQVFCQDNHTEPDGASNAVASLGRPPRLLDLGANIGVYSAWAATRWPGVEITSVEPDPSNVAVLIAASAANGGWNVIDSAAGVEETEMRFSAGRFAVSRAAGDDEQGDGIVTVPVVDVFDLLSANDIIKLDIEGGEWEILADPRLKDAEVAALTVEYHEHLCPSSDTHQLAEELVRAAGFECERMPSIPGAPAAEGILWCWRGDGAR